MIIQEQSDFSGGMWRGRRAPENAFYDGVNVLLNDEGEPFKRGGSAYESTSDAGATLLGLEDVVLPDGTSRLIAWPSSGASMYALNGSNAPVTLAIEAGGPPPPFSRGARYGPFTVFRGTGANNDGHILYAGSLKASYTVSCTITAGSASITGTGFTANVDVGMLIPNGTEKIGVVKSVNSNTSITLVDPWVGSTGTFSLTFKPILAGGFNDWSTAGTSQYGSAGKVALVDPVAHVGIAGYLAVLKGNKITFSARYGSHTKAGLGLHSSGSAGTEFDHELPVDVRTIGAERLGQDTLLTFTNAGCWRIDNLDLDPLSDFGDVQHTVTEINELVLWQDPGIAKWQGAVVAPCIDNVYLMPLDGAPVPISEPIRDLYRSYVAAGYTPGLAAVTRGHYVLPIVNGTTLVDVLACRLDRGFAWSRLSAGAAGVAYAQRVGTSGQPSLFGLTAARVSNLTGIFTPTDSNRTDADGSTPTFSLTTRDINTGPGIKGGLLRHFRLEYDLIAPSSTATLTVSSAVGAEGSAFTAHASTAAEGDGAVETWMLNASGERVRVKIESSGASADLRLRRCEFHTEPVQRP